MNKLEELTAAVGAAYIPLDETSYKLTLADAAHYAAKIDFSKAVKELEEYMENERVKRKIERLTKEGAADVNTTTTGG
jgi:hypothetical protein